MPAYRYDLLAMATMTLALWKALDLIVWVISHLRWS